MEKLLPIGRYFFAIAFIGIGIEHFIFRDFIAGRAPALPDTSNGKLIWAYLTGGFFIVMSIALILDTKARLASIIAALLIFSWALLRHIPVVAADSFLSGAWTNMGKSLTFFGGLLAIAATYPREEIFRNTTLKKFINFESEFIIIARYCLGIFLVITGIQHFIFTGFVASLIPVWFPGNAAFWTYFGGVALISGGLGLFIPQTSRPAALMTGIMIFSWFWIVHIPRTFASISDGIAVFEALAVSGIAFVLYGYLRKSPA